MRTFDCVLVFGVVIMVCSRPAVRARSSYCGKELADALELLCDSTYYAPNATRQERSLRSIHKRKPVLYILHRRRRNVPITNGIVDECCRNTCSVQQLRAYCG